MHKNDLFRACQVLFGPDVEVSRDFLHYIQSSGVKSAYRRIARMTHPDSAISGGHRGMDSERFIEANWAYESLKSFIEHRDRTPWIRDRVGGRDEPARGATVRRGRWGASAAAGPGCNFFSGPAPERRLLFGEFLFYSGEVPWEAFIKAIVWQRGQRPRCGDMALQWGWVRRRHLVSALRWRRNGEFIGEALVRLKFMSRLQVDSLLKAQRKAQKPFGEFFIENGYLSRSHLNAENHFTWITVLIMRCSPRQIRT